MFAGNILRQSAHPEIEVSMVGEVKNTKFFVRQVFWLDVFRSLKPAKLKYGSTNKLVFAAQAKWGVAVV